MTNFVIDFIIFAILVIGITAFLSIFTNAIGEKVFGRKTRTIFTSKSRSIQKGWNAVGGKGIYRKKFY
ncbi:MAG: hypothetical protein ACI35O_08735 [Bacillaceae bacterium]